MDTEPPSVVDDAVPLPPPVVEPPAHGGAFRGVGAAIGLLIWSVLLTLPAGIVAGFVGHFRPWLAVPFSLPCIGLAVLAVVALARYRWGVRWRLAFPLAPVRPALLVWSVLCGVGAFFVQLTPATLGVRIFGNPGMGDPRQIYGLWGLVLVVPIFEEVLFRGYGLARITQVGGSQRRAVILTALAFAAAHVHPARLPGTFLVGLICAWLVLRSRSLVPAILVHGFNNTVAVGIMAVAGGTSLARAAAPPWALVVPLSVAGAVPLMALAVPSFRARLFPPLSDPTPDAQEPAGDDNRGSAADA